MSAKGRALLRRHADPSRAAALQRFFKTAPGEYAEGDKFLGVTVPTIRRICRECRGTAVADALMLLRSPIHEDRLLALLLLVDAFKAGTEPERQRIYRAYVAHTRFINNWNLVDSSASQIVGAWLRDRSRAQLTRFARSPSVWERRIAIIATQHFIGQQEFGETFRVADLLLEDDHDLIHKAVGWMLREVGNRDGRSERAFLKTRYRRMPRTMLRYAIEKFPERERRSYLTGEV
jgi:3-methyladenine DNA glycosylase AlkD